MKARIEVDIAKREHKKILEEALREPEILAFVLVVGLMNRLPSDRARRRVLSFVNDALTDPHLHPRKVTVEKTA